MNPEQKKLIARHMGMMITALNHAARLRILYYAACIQHRAELVEMELPIHPSVDVEIMWAAESRDQIVAAQQEAVAALKALVPGVVVMVRFDYEG